jgi:hypothetical protein
MAIDLLADEDNEDNENYINSLSNEYNEDRINLLADEDDKGGIDLLADESSPQTNSSKGSISYNPLKGIERVAGDIVGGFATAGEGLHNTPYNIAKMISPKLASYMPSPDKTDWFKYFGPQDPNLADKAIQSMSQYGPYGIAGEAMLAGKGIAGLSPLATSAIEQGGIGGLFGATQSENPGAGAVTGALINAGGSAAGSAAGNAIHPAFNQVKSYLSKFSAKGISDEIGNILENAKNMTNEEAFDIAKKNHESMTEKESNAWNNLTKTVNNADRFKMGSAKPREEKNEIMARPSSELSSRKQVAMRPTMSKIGPKPIAPKKDRLVDQETQQVGKANEDREFILAKERQEQKSQTSQPGEIIEGSYRTPFQNKGYINDLKSELHKLQGESRRQSGFARTHKDAISLLHDYISDTHNTFQSALEHNKALNRDYENEITPGKSIPFRTVNYAKSKLKEAIENNIDKQKLNTTVGVAWDNANKFTQDKNQIFNELVSPKGKEQYSSFSQFLNGKNPYSDRGNFIKDYLPSGTKESLDHMKQLGKMVGNDQEAKNIIKANYFDKAYTSGKFDSKKFLSKYNSLKPHEQEHLFNEEQRKHISSLNKILELHPNALNKTRAHTVLSHTMPMLIGGGIGQIMGHPLIGAVAGHGLARTSEVALEKMMSNPKVALKLSESLNKGYFPKNTALNAKAMGLASLPAWINNQ